MENYEHLMYASNEWDTKSVYIPAPGVPFGMLTEREKEFWERSKAYGDEHDKNGHLKQKYVKEWHLE